ncbi:MAG: GntR family transcriptional regulator [Synergistales bacterium]|uniref:GntR family transcriptional regulator n=1 Tax=Aminivibrio sp. TaxID=1872489 RepID=UPI001A41CBD5|nr:GntR family transcriptional regulator [Aminivibrio sp.]MBL3539350.1 GntR family transcriptional regulator [Aminivibrio sp.]NCB15440.1 GntR family transcriptional regulator [Synergistales bacterium]
MIAREVLPKENGETVRDWAFRTILHDLVSLVLPPGSAVSENDVASPLGSSRTPVRENFIRLVQDGLLDVYPQKGTYRFPGGRAEGGGRGGI